MAGSTYSSASKVLRVLKALKGHTLRGLSNNDLARMLDESPSAITRSVDTLIAENLAQRLPDGRFALSVGALQIAQAHANEMDRAMAHIQEINTRVVAGAR